MLPPKILLLATFVVSLSSLSQTEITTKPQKPQEVPSINLPEFGTSTKSGIQDLKPLNGISKLPSTTEREEENVDEQKHETTKPVPSINLPEFGKSTKGGIRDLKPLRGIPKIPLSEREVEEDEEDVIKPKTSLGIKGLKPIGISKINGIEGIQDVDGIPSLQRKHKDYDDDYNDEEEEELRKKLKKKAMKKKVKKAKRPKVKGPRSGSGMKLNMPKWGMDDWDTTFSDDDMNMDMDMNMDFGDFDMKMDDFPDMNMDMDMGDFPDMNMNMDMNMDDFFSSSKSKSKDPKQEEKRILGRHAFIL